MNTTARVLCPPNFQNMSGEVIRNVTERSYPKYDLVGDSVKQYKLPFLDRLPTHTHHPIDTSERSCCTHESRREFSDTRPTTEKMTKKYSSAGSMDPSFKTLPVTGHTELTKNKLQARQRVYQRTYRARREAYRITLENETRQLQNEIEQLKVQRTKDTLWAMVAEYFSLLRQSVKSRSSLSSLNAVHNADRLVMKRTFHHNNMMMCWCLPRNFGHVDVELQQLKRSSRNTLIATTVTSFIITGRTLATVFPHLCNRDGKHGGAIATRLLHKRVVMRGSARFERDDTTPHVLRITSESDLLTPLLNLLGSLEEVAIVFEEAFVTPDFQWKSKYM